MGITLIVGNCNCRDATNQLINKKPKPSLLKNKAQKIKNKYLRLLDELSFSKENTTKYFIFID
jgi:hypothetical protein